MIPMRLFLFLTCLCLSLSAQAEEGFLPLFNGKDLSGWKEVNTAPSTWSFNEEGYLVCSGIPIGEIRTERMYQNFVLELEWRHLVPKGNAGVFAWADDISAVGKPFIRSIEVQVLENDYGNTKHYSTHGDIFPIQGATMTPFNGRGGQRAFPTENRSNPSPEWNHYRIECRDGEISLAVNGKVVTRGKDSVPRKGYICIESEGGVVHYRNVRIKELPSTPVKPEHTAVADRGFSCLYTGVDFSGWESASGWQSQDWEMIATADAKPLVTERSYHGDLEFIVDFLCEDKEATQRISIRGAELSISGDHPDLNKPGQYNRIVGTIRDNALTYTVNTAEQDVEPIPVSNEKGPFILSPGGKSNWCNPYLRKLPVGSLDEIELKGKVVFLGDSITNAGHYISTIEAALLESGKDPESFELINLGLSSEGVTGLSEPSHPFPRPNVHERLQRALTKIQPDLVLACYGMNDGIYHPYNADRFSQYVKGIESLIEQVNETETPLILLTPPPFDPEPFRKKGKLKPSGEETYSWSEIYENYDTDVMEIYSNWLLEQHNRVSGIIDIRNPILNYTEKQRKEDPEFALSNDGVHINAEGHDIIAAAILDALGFPKGTVSSLDKSRVAKVHKEQMLMHAAWLTYVGHKRPGVKDGLPLEEARKLLEQGKE